MVAFACIFASVYGEAKLNFSMEAPINKGGYNEGSSVIDKSNNVVNQNVSIAQNEVNNNEVHNDIVNYKKICDKGGKGCGN